MLWVFLILCAGLGRPGEAQMIQNIPINAQVKITEMPFPVNNAQQIGQIQWTMLGTSTKETIYCVSEPPVTQLRFVCDDCLQRNITDMVSILNSAQDLTRDAGFPTIALRNIAVNTNWTGATIYCQANANGVMLESAPAVVDVRFLRQPHVVDSNGQGPVLLQTSGNRFYVECQRDQAGMCLNTGRRKTLRCLTHAHPPPTAYRWLKNGVITSGNGAEITIGPEMIGQSLQCSANNGLYSDSEAPISQAVQIDPYSAAEVVTDNFNNIESSALMAGGRVQIDNEVKVVCQVRGNPRPIVFWRLRKLNGQVVDAACQQGYDGVYQEVATPQQPMQVMQNQIPSNIVTLNSHCIMKVANYSFAGQLWCSACSQVSQGTPECQPSLDTPGSKTLTIQVQGPPMQSDAPTSIEQAPGTHNAVVTVHYCADPPPTPPRDIIFEIDKHDLMNGQSWDNFRFEGFSQNNTVPNCFYAKLGISRVSESDQYRQIFLRVTNSKGQRSIPIQLEALLGGGGASSGRISGAWIAFIVLLALCVIVAALITICVRKQMFCFNRTKDTEEDLYSHTKPKNLAPTIHTSFDEPRLFAPSPVEARKSPSFHEGLNYAEMRLTDSLDRPPIMGRRSAMSSTV